MLRLPPFRYHRPATVDEAVALLGEHAGDVMPVAGGTDLVPNMKHRLFEPGHLVALKGIGELQGIREEDGWLRIGAAETLRRRWRRTRRCGGAFPRSPTRRATWRAHSSATWARSGGNLCLDTRCTYYNQTAFWRGALGYCLKKDGDVCHVTKRRARSASRPIRRTRRPCS